MYPIFGLLSSRSIQKHIKHEILSPMVKIYKIPKFGSHDFEGPKTPWL